LVNNSVASKIKSLPVAGSLRVKTVVRCDGSRPPVPIDQHQRGAELVSAVSCIC
jgi:hypothetical protein